MYTDIFCVTDPEALHSELQRQLKESRFHSFPLKLLAELNPDLIITDINLKHMAGIRKLYYLKDVKSLCLNTILLLSGRSQQSPPQNCSDRKPNNWLIKPVAPENLAEIIRKVAPETPISD